MGLTRKIWLNDEGTDVKMRPVDALHTLEGDVLATGENLTLEQANDALANYISPVDAVFNLLFFIY